MHLSDRLRVARGRSFLSALWVARLVLRPVGLSGVYDRLLRHLVARTGLFDDAYYLEHHPDLADLEIEPLRHYVVEGDQEGRLPMAFFDPGHYRAQVSGRTKDLNAILHYLLVGRHQRISPSPWFDINYYLQDNPDVAFSGIDPLSHYLKWGGVEGRSPSPEFDGAYYLRHNPDVVQAGTNPLLHYLTSGRFDNRPTSPRASDQKKSDVSAVPWCITEADPWEGLEPRAGVDEAIVDVVVPVYGGRAETLACLRSVLSARVCTRFELVVINDASPDAELSQSLQQLGDIGFLTLMVNSENQGFVATANRGLMLHEDRDVVLLNADTEVYDGWLDRLHTAAYRHPQTATVTPLSNNATICSYPRFLHDNPYPLELAYQALDRLTAEVNAGVEIEAPTGVGFCLYLRRDCLQDVGTFDVTHFGKGYGEENDYCQRAIGRGWRNVVAADVFVRHWGGVSFKGDTARRIHQATKVIDRLHPRYLNDVADFIQRDPVAPARAQLDWTRLLRLRREKNVLIVCHNRGGGTERHVREDAERFMDAGYGVFYMRPVRTDKVRVVVSHAELSFVPNLEAYDMQDVEGLVAVLEQLGISEIHTHSLIDFEPESPRHLQEIVRRLGARWEVNLHDYKVVCPRISLVDQKGRYCGEPGEAGCNQCLAVRGSSFGIRDISGWRAMHREALMAANEVLVPDEDVAVRLGNYFADLKIKVSPHDDTDQETSRRAQHRPRGRGKVHVVAIGAINKHKGVDVMIRCARDARRNERDLAFSLLGFTSNDNAARREGIRLTGRYHDDFAVDQLIALAPDIIWLPSTCPETYSYTLSIALQLDCPVAAFDLGAIAARLRRSNRAECLMPLALADHPEEINSRFLEVVMNGQVDSYPNVSARS